MSRTLQLQNELCILQPDVPRRTLSRDYDAIFLLIPFTLFAAFVSAVAGGATTAPRYIFIGVLTTGFSCMLFLEQLNRQYRYQTASGFRLSGLFWVTAIAAVNLAVWLAVL